MKILITGAGGMLGTDLSAALEKHFEVSGAGLSPADRRRYHQLDLSVPQNAESVISRERPSIIFHTAAMTDVDGCENRRDEALKANVEMTRHLTDSANRAGALFIFFSTDYVFDGKKKGEYTEEDKPAPASFYGETKWMAEKYIQQNARKYAILRISWLYGLWGKSFPRTILERARTQTRFDVVDDQIGRPTYTKDLAGALRDVLVKDPMAFEKNANQIYHLSNQGSASWAAFAEYLLKEGGFSTAKVTPITSDRLNRAAKRPANSLMSLRKAEEKLGIKMRPWQDAAKDFIVELKNENKVR